MVKNVTSTDIDSLYEKKVYTLIYSKLLAELCQFIIRIFDSAYYFLKLVAF